MDVVELTKLFVEYKETANKLALLEKSIQDEILKCGESQQIAGVKATYYKPTLEYNYEEAAKGHPMVSDVTLDLFTTVMKRVRWAEVCEHVGIEKDDIPCVEKPARVVVKG